MTKHVLYLSPSSTEVIPSQVTHVVFPPPGQPRLRLSVTQCTQKERRRQERAIKDQFLTQLQSPHLGDRLRAKLRIQKLLSLRPPPTPSYLSYRRVPVDTILSFMISNRSSYPEGVCQYGKFSMIRLTKQQIDDVLKQRLTREQLLDQLSSVVCETCATQQEITSTHYRRLGPQLKNTVVRPSGGATGCVAHLSYPTWAVESLSPT